MPIVCWPVVRGLYTSALAGGRQRPFVRLSHPYRDIRGLRRGAVLVIETLEGLEVEVDDVLGPAAESSLGFHRPVAATGAKLTAQTGFKFPSTLWVPSERSRFFAPSGPDDCPPEQYEC